MYAPPLFEVILPFTTWRQTVLPMLADPALVATGMLIRDPGRLPTGLLANELTTGARPRTGGDFPPLADWIAIAAPRGRLPQTPEAWMQRLQPRFAQLLVVLLIGSGTERGTWRGWTMERGLIRPLAGLRIIGPGMVHVENARIENQLTPADAARWTRLRGAVGEATFAKVRETQVAIIGCSRTGTLAASTFAALGVNRLTLIDGDTIEPHNLDGMILSTEADLGSNKAITLGRRLVEFRSDMTVKALPHPLNGRWAETALAGAGLIVTTVDQDAPRLRAAHEARARLVPHLDIGTGVTRTATGERQLAADVRLLLPGSGCVRCVGGLGDLEQAEYEYHAPPGAMPRRPPEPWNARGRLGSLITLNQLAVASGIQSWLDLLDGSLPGSIWHRLRWVARPRVGGECRPGGSGGGVSGVPDWLKFASYCVVLKKLMKK